MRFATRTQKTDQNLRLKTHLLLPALTTTGGCTDVFLFKCFDPLSELIVQSLAQQAIHPDFVPIGVIVTNVNEDGTLPPHVEYKIRQNATFTHSTKKIRPSYWFPGPMNWGYNYYQFGFVWIQVELASVVGPGSGNLHEITEFRHARGSHLFGQHMAREIFLASIGAKRLFWTARS